MGRLIHPGVANARGHCGVSNRWVDMAAARIASVQLTPSCSNNSGGQDPMKKLKVMKLKVMLSVAVLAAGAWFATSAEAGHGSWGASYGSYGSSGGFYSTGGSSGGFYSSGSHGSSGRVGHVGPLRRLAARIHARRAARFHSSGGSYGSHGSSGGSYGSYGSSGGSYGSHGAVAYHWGGSSGGYGAVHSHHGAMPEYAPGEVIMEEPEGDQPPAEPVEPQVEDGAAILTLAVPEHAIVRVNGKQTTSTGTIRQFMSDGLEKGYVYRYDVEVSYEGSEVVDTKTIKLRSGTAERLVFSGPQADTLAAQQTESPETVVTVRVPEDAEVTLAGSQASGSGQLRTFRTRQLAPGQSWNDYTIRVTAMVDGSPISQQQTIDVDAGSRHDLVFDFDSTELASR